MQIARQHKVLIVDDSESICRFLEKLLSADPELHVVGYALNAYEARDLIKETQPDVLTLDVEMPRMDGLTFLRNIMRLRPMPVVMVSSLTAAGAAVTLDALEAGAVDFMVKRHPRSQEELTVYTQEIVKRVKAAANIRVRQPTLPNRTITFLEQAGLTQKYKAGHQPTNNIKRLLAIGASTGGPDALRHLLTTLYSPDCAVVIAQHMPERFMPPFANRLNSVSEFNITLAKDGEQIKPGCGYVAPGDLHLAVTRKNSKLYCRVTREQHVNGHRPSVDVLFKSIADNIQDGAVGVLLTGMGNDGADGLAKMRLSGSTTIVQDEKSSAVWGMPGRAWQAGGADKMLSLQDIAPSINLLTA